MLLTVASSQREAAISRALASALPAVVAVGAAVQPSLGGLCVHSCQRAGTALRAVQASAADFVQRNLLAPAMLKANPFASMMAVAADSSAAVVSSSRPAHFTHSIGTAKACRVLRRRPSTAGRKKEQSTSGGQIRQVQDGMRSGMLHCSLPCDPTLTVGKQHQQGSLSVGGVARIGSWRASQPQWSVEAGLQSSLL